MTLSKRSRLAFILLASLHLAACGDDGSPPLDAGSDAGDSAVATCDPVSADFELGSATGHAAPLGAADGEARAGVLGAGDLPADPTGLLTWSEGDFVLANSKVAVVIEAMGASDGYDPWGGKIVGLARMEAGGMFQPADFNEVIPAVGRFTVEPTSVGVLNDGADGSAAVVRMVGALAAIPFVDEFAAGLIRGEFDDIQVAVDYSLAPDAEVVDVSYTFVNSRPRAARFDPVFLIFQRDRMPSFAADRGFQGAGGDAVPWIAFIDPQHTSYAIEPGLGDMTLLLEVSGTMVFEGDVNFIDACSRSEKSMYRLHVGGPGVDGLREAMARTAGTSTRTITGVVREADGSGAAGVDVHAESADGSSYLTRAHSAADGSYTLHVPDGMDVRLTPFRLGDEVPAATAVPASSGTQDLALGDHGFIHVLATDESGVGLPVRVQVMPDGMPLPTVPNSFGVSTVARGRMHTVFPVDGDVTLPVPVGNHRVIVSRGTEYELGFDSVVSVAADATTEVAATLVRVVDTTGVMCADYHVHTWRSPDSPDPGEFKLRSAAGDGLEIPCRSDHEWVRDFETQVAELGISPWVYGVTSLELTTFAWGHFGVVPMQIRPELPNGGSIDWVGRKPPEVFNDVRALPWSPALIINHPRSGGIGGYFSAVGYDATTGTVAKMDMWDEDWTVMEAFNDSSFEENADGLVQDWFSFLRAGRKVFVVGSSDSHKVLRGSPVGYPRTCLYLGVDDPEALRTAGSNLVRDTTLSGAMYVSGGIFLDVSVGGAGPGETVTGTGATALVHARVQAPSWVSVDTLEVYVNGDMVGTVDLSGSTEVIRYEDDLMIDVPAGGGWVVLHVKGDRELDPVFPGRGAFAVSNPIFLEP
ncbi:MAG: CehA/McbA family metallohydrolase [Deltaproteobacteria bacterium]|nr:CehA/McbA family metallohydrolase [Deltaproteobacteria bacterium]